MKFGLKNKVWDEICSICKKYADVKAVYLYGSRAREEFKKTSDIDLAIKFLTHPNSLSKIKWDLESIDVLQKIDVLDYDNIENKDLKFEIDTSKKELYKSSA